MAELVFKIQRAYDDRDRYHAELLESREKLKQIKEWVKTYENPLVHPDAWAELKAILKHKKRLE